MLADPWINWCAQGVDEKSMPWKSATPSKRTDWDTKIDGVMVSDFITPSWFEPTEADRVDFKRRIAKPLELASEGYISVLDAGGGWTQVAALGSRRQRRNLGKAEWRNSQQ